MGDDLEPVLRDEGVTEPPSNARILVLMAVVGLVGGVAGAVYRSTAFGVGILAGTALAFVNYLWLRQLLAKIFAAAAEGEKPRMLVAGYFLRYLTMAVVVAIVYFSKAVPIAAFIVGLAGFGFAVVLDGFIRIFSGIFSSKEI